MIHRINLFLEFIIKKGENRVKSTKNL